MPYYPQIGDLIESRIVCYTPKQISINVIHWRRLNVIPVGTGASLEEMAQRIDNLVVSAYKALMSSQAKYRGVGCKVITLPATVEYSTTLNDGAGTIVADMMPTQTTYVIQKRSVLAGRRNIGRIYPGFPPITAGEPDGDMAVAYQATVAALAATFDANFFPMGVTGATGDTDFVPVIKHSGGTSFTDIDHFLPGTKFATQRRRGQYGKENVLPF